MNSNGKNMKIFTANSHPELASRIAKNLGIPLSPSEVSRFSDGEISVSIGESVRGAEVFVVQPTSDPVNDYLMELLIMADAFKRASAASITAVIPYFGYARQDRKAKARDAISAKLVANLITAAGVDRVLTMDLHSPQIQGFFDIPLDHLLGVALLAEDFRLKHGTENLICVSPDLGSVTRARSFAQKIGIGLAIIDKRRAKANVSEVVNIIGDVRDKRVVIVDDVVDTAGTLCNAAKALIEIGGAREVYASATHGVLSGEAVARIKDSVITKTTLLDTINIPKSKLGGKIATLDTSELFADAIMRICSDQPVSPLFA